VSVHQRLGFTSRCFLASRSRICLSSDFRMVIFIFSAASFLALSSAHALGFQYDATGACGISPAKPLPPSPG
jgi:hypothetical protein